MDRSIYIFSNGELKRKDNTFYLELGNEKKYIPVENTEEFHLFGEVSINKKLIDFISQQGILIHFYNYYGFYEGSYYPREHYNSGALILKQAEFYNNYEKRIEIAKRIVKGAILNILRVMEYYNNRDVNLRDEIGKINEYFSKLDSARAIDEIMGLEGNARNVYYHSFDKIIKSDEFSLNKREKHPPSNEMNALISFGNSLIYTYVLSEIYKTHLDPRIGFLHTTNFRRFSLNLDIAEIFKPIIVDRSIFKLINKQMIGKKHFMEELNGIYLNESGRKIFVSEVDSRLKTTILHRKLNRNVSYRELIKLELYKIEKHILGIEEYEPFVIWW